VNRAYRCTTEERQFARLVLCRTRSLDVSDTERERITSCTDLKQLKKWVTRAVTAEKTSDLFD
jgi:hypothetical protein